MILRVRTSLSAPVAGAIGLSLAAFAIVAVILALSFGTARVNRLDRLRTETESRALLLASIGDGVLRQAELTVTLLGADIEARGFTAEASQFARTLSQLLPAAGCVWATRADGRTATPGCPWFPELPGHLPPPVAGSETALGLSFVPERGLALLRRALVGSDGAGGGAVAGGAVWAAFDAAALLGYGRSIGGDPVEAIATTDGRVVAGPDLAFAQRAGEKARTAAHLLVAGDAPADAIRAASTPDLIAAAAQIRSFPLLAIAAAPVEPTLAPWWNAVAMTVIIGVLASGVFAVLIVQLLRADRRRAVALADLSLKDQALSQSANAVIICAAAPGKPIVYVNEAFERNTGYRASEVLGQNPSLLQGAESDQDALSGVREALQADRPVQATLRNYRKDGSSFYNDVSIAPVRDASGRVTHYIGIQQDATARVESARALEALAAQRDAERLRAEAANRAKSDFLACMSHELRTPLNAILGFSEIIRDRAFGADLPRYAEYAGDIHSSGAHLLDLINDILDLSKIEAGRLDLALGPQDIARQLHAVERLVRQRAADHRHTLSIGAGEAEGRMIVADSRAFRQILFNLLSNAIKFTPDGGRIEVVCTLAPEDRITIIVRDTGIGIPPDRVQMVLQPFVRLNDTYTRSQEGTGLGLSLVDRLVAAHGGTLAIESTVGVGTAVSVTFREARAAVLAA